MERYTHMRFGWLVALAACGPAAAPPPLSGSATTSASESPTPTIAWRGREIATTGLPAIARDGSSVVLAHRDTDGGRGNPNVTLIEKDRDDRAVGQLVVVTATDVDELTPAQLAERFAKAGAWLRERHAARHLVPLTTLATSRPTDDAAAQATGTGVTLRWVPNQLVIERPHGAPVTRATPVSWLAADHPMCRNCSEVCHNDAFLGGGHVDLERSVAIVVVSYRGTDTCWEPSSDEHVVAW